jgi:hypothetical protein
MKTIRLLDHELSVVDYSNFELNLLLREGRVTATVKPSKTNGVKRVQLINPVVLFDETRVPEERIERLVKYFRFQRKDMERSKHA